MSGISASEHDPADFQLLTADSLTCPFCEAGEPELVSLFGSQLLTSQYRCRACGSYFEAVRTGEDEQDGG